MHFHFSVQQLQRQVETLTTEQQQEIQLLTQKQKEALQRLTSQHRETLSAKTLVADKLQGQLKTLQDTSNGIQTRYAELKAVHTKQQEVYMAQKQEWETKQKAQQASLEQYRAETDKVMAAERSKRQQTEMKLNTELLNARMTYSDQLKGLETKVACSEAELKLSRVRIQELDDQLLQAKKKEEEGNKRHLAFIKIEAEHNFFEKDNAKKEEELAKLRALVQRLERSERDAGREGLATMNLNLDSLT